MAEFSIFGASGFIGSHLGRSLESDNHIVRRIDRDHWPRPGEHLANIIYAIGLTADFRSKPIETVQAHVGLVADVISSYSFLSFLYLSSTRVYEGAETGNEDTPINFDPNRRDNLYGISKLAGEALCLAIDRPTIRIVRASNVIRVDESMHNFLPSLMVEGYDAGQVTIRTAPDSCKDYIDIEDVTRVVPMICLEGRHRLYNVASGTSITNAEIAELLRCELGVRVQFANNALEVKFPNIKIDRVTQEFGFRPTPFATSFNKLNASMQHRRRH
jgi:nucleoside-diphosphate-sugar epimerase